MTAAAAPLSRDWPHGWEIRGFAGEDPKPARVLCDDMPGAFPWVAYCEHVTEPVLLRFRADGTAETSSFLRLRNAPAPRASGTVWVNVYRGPEKSYGHPSREKADRCASSDRLACVKIDWTEGDGLEPQP